MMQQLTSKRLGRRAYFRSLLMVGLVAGGSCASSSSLMAQLPNGSLAPNLVELSGAPPSLDYTPALQASLPSIDASVATLPSAPHLPPAAAAGPATADADAPTHIVQLLGLVKARGYQATSRTSITTTPSPTIAATQIPRPRTLSQIKSGSPTSAVQQVQYAGSPKAARGACVPASQASPAATASGVTHAYLAESNSAVLQGTGRAILRPLSSDSVVDASTSAKNTANEVRTSEPSRGDDGSAEEAAVVGAPVKFDAALAGGAAEVAETTTSPESESLLDLDLSSLAAQGPTEDGQPSAGPSRGPRTASILEETPPKLIATEPGSLSDAQPITRAPQLALPGDSSDGATSKRTPLRAQLASQRTSPTRVEIHETFTPRESRSGESYHLSDAAPVKTQPVALAGKPNQGPKLAERAQAAAQQMPEPRRAEEPKLAAEALPAAGLKRAEAFALSEPAQPTDEHEETKVQAAPTLALASPPALLPPAAALLGLPETPADATTAASKPAAALAAPFMPGTEGLVVKASRPGLERGQSSRSALPLTELEPPATELPAPQVPAEAMATSQAPQIAASTSHRLISLRIGGQATEAAPASERAQPAPKAEQRALSDHNPLATIGPVVRPVKQPVKLEPVAQAAGFTKPAEKSAATAQPTGAPANASESQLVQELIKAIKKSFPNSRVELKTDEEGLVVEGVAASESEAKKILAMVRTTALCPVADRIITKR